MQKNQKDPWSWNRLKKILTEGWTTLPAQGETKVRKRGRGYTKAKPNKKKIKMRREMAKNSNRINRKRIRNWKN